MNHPVIMQANAQMRYDGMLEAAKTYRKVKRLERQAPVLLSRIRSAFGDALIAVLDWLKVQRRTDAEMAVLKD